MGKGAERCPDRGADGFVTIPMAILDRDDLLPIAKLLYGLVLSLSRQKGYCWASNAHLAARLACSVRHVQDTLSSLEGRGLVSVRRPSGPSGERHIHPAAPPRSVEPQSGAGEPRVTPPLRPGSSPTRAVVPPAREPRLTHNILSEQKRENQTPTADAMPRPSVTPATPGAAEQRRISALSSEKRRPEGPEPADPWQGLGAADRSPWMEQARCRYQDSCPGHSPRGDVLESIARNAFLKARKCAGRDTVAA